MTATIAKIKCSRPATVGLPTAEAAMQRAREQEQRIALESARTAGRLKLRSKLLWLVTGLLIGFTAGHFKQIERPVMEVRR